MGLDVEVDRDSASPSSEHELARRAIDNALCLHSDRGSFLGRDLEDVEVQEDETLMHLKALAAEKARLASALSRRKARNNKLNELG